MSASPVPLPLKLALAGAALEALALVAGGGTVLVRALASAGRGGILGVTISLAVVLVGFALLLLGAARAQWHGQRWGRGPIVTWQLLQAATAVALAEDLPFLVVAGVLLLSAAITAGVLWPSSREYAAATRSPSVV